MSIARNTLYGLASAGVQIVTTLITVPIYLPTIGADRFGVLVIVWVLLGYFGFTNLGTGAAATHRIAAARDAEPIERQRIFWTSLWVSLGLGMVGALVLAGAAWVAIGWIRFGNDSLRAEFVDAIPLIAFLLPVTAVRGVVAGALQGVERFLALSVIGTLAVVLSSVLPLFIALAFSTEIGWLLFGVLVANVFAFILSYIICRRALPLSGLSRPDRPLIGSLLRFGGWVTVSGVVGPLMVTFDRIIIGSMASAAAVAHYSVPNDLLQRLWIIPGSLTSALFPRLSAILKNSDRLELGDDALKWLAFIMTPLSLLALAVVEPFLIVWLGRAFAAQASDVAHIFLFGIWINSLARIPAVMLQGQGRPDLMAKTHVIEMMPYFLVLYVGLATLGLPGAALAWSLRCAADAIILALLAGFEAKRLIYLGFPTAVMSAGSAACLVWPVESGARWLALGVAALACAAWCVRNIPPGFSHQLSRLRLASHSRGA